MTVLDERHPAFEQLQQPDEVVYLPYREGVFAASKSGLIEIPDHRQALESFIEQCDGRGIGGLALQSSLATDLATERLGSGGEGSVYGLRPSGTMAVKVVAGKVLSMSDPVASLTHMERLRTAIEGMGQQWIGVPRHHGLYLPNHGRYSLLLTDRVEGYDVHRVLNAGEHDIPSVFSELAVPIAMSYTLLESTLRAWLPQYGYRYGDLVGDWASANVVVSLGTVKDQSPLNFKFWIVDQSFL